MELENEATVSCRGCKNMLNNCWGKKTKKEGKRHYELLLMRLLREKTGNLKNKKIKNNHLLNT